MLPTFPLLTTAADDPTAEMVIEPARMATLWMNSGRRAGWLRIPAYRVAGSELKFIFDWALLRLQACSLNHPRAAISDSRDKTKAK